ncbi:MAG: 4Fe-4S dicluster domain-containing protein [Candidatus Rokubacteria bacterium]|nr:4Fe-4S dicluster domain-containing protein [Candidatus Rokubacteria bacterium]
MRLGAFDHRDPPALDGLRACVHCGICLPQCPTYRVLGEEMDSPRGRVYLIRAAAEGRLSLTPTFTRHLDLCLGCRACESACPSGVPFGQLLEATRGQIERQASRPLGQRVWSRLLLSVFPSPRRLALLLGAARFYQRSGLQRLVRATRLLRPIRRLAALDALLPNTLPNRERTLPEMVPARGRRRGTVGLLVGCVQRLLFPRVNAESVRLLARAGYELLIPRNQGCCGAMHLHAGRIDEARSLASRLMAHFGREVDFVVTNAAGCGSAMRDYPHWLRGDPEVEAFSLKVRDIAELLAECELPLQRLDVTVTYHDACHLAHGQRVRSQPRQMLARIPGVTLVELADSELCCGSAGVYNLLQPEMADRLLTLKLECIAASGATVVATGNPGCILQIDRGCRARGLAVEVLHPVELLGRAVREEG